MKVSRYKFESFEKAQKKLGRRIAGETNTYGIDGISRDVLEQLLQSKSEDDLALLEAYLNFRDPDGANIFLRAIHKCNFVFRDDLMENMRATSFLEIIDLFVNTDFLLKASEKLQKKYDSSYLKATNNFGETAVFLASSKKEGMVSALQLLLSDKHGRFKDQINQSNNSGYYPVDFVAAYSKPDNKGMQYRVYVKPTSLNAVLLLLAHGAELKLSNQNVIGMNTEAALIGDLFDDFSSYIECKKSTGNNLAHKIECTKRMAMHYRRLTPEVSLRCYMEAARDGDLGAMCDVLILLQEREKLKNPQNYQEIVLSSYRPDMEQIRQITACSQLKEPKEVREYALHFLAQMAYQEIVSGKRENDMSKLDHALKHFTALEGEHAKDPQLLSMKEELEKHRARIMHKQPPSLQSTQETSVPIQPVSDGLHAISGCRQSAEVSVRTNSMFKPLVEKVDKTDPSVSPAMR